MATKEIIDGNPTADEMVKLNNPTTHREQAAFIAEDISDLIMDKGSEDNHVEWERVHQQLLNIYNEIRPDIWP